MNNISLVGTLLIFFLLWGYNSYFTFAVFFHIDANWTSFPGSLGNNIDTDRGTFYPAAAPGAKWISDNAFTLGFLQPTNSNRFLLSVLLSAPYIPPTIIWSLNYFRPTVGNCSLSLTGDGILALKDSVGSTIGSLGGSGAKMIGMMANGNFIVYNTNDASEAHVGNIIWQSWDHPSDVLLPGQILRQGTSLSSGDYSLTMYPGGAVMNISDQPYMTFPMTTDSSAASVINPCFADENSWAEFTGNSLVLYYSGITEISSKSCTFRNASTFLQSDDAMDASVTFLRLDPDGNLRTYWVPPFIEGSSISPEVGWHSDPFVLPSDVCKLPKFCGPYGLCRNGQCSCPASMEFNRVDPKNASAGCQPKNKINCTDGKSVATRFVRLPAFHYFLADNMASQNQTSDQLGCESLCQASCPCVAYFYEKISGKCFLLSGLVYTLQFVGNESYTAGVKIQTTSDNHTTALVPSSSPSSSDQPNGLRLGAGRITGIILGCVAIVLMALLFWVWRRILFSHLAVVDKVEEDRKDEEVGEEEFLRALPGLPPRFTYAELRAATAEFAEKLGSGGFGTVFSGKLLDGTRVAVKRLDTRAGTGGKQFRAEVATIGSISHVNLVRLRGFCADKQQRLLVYELVANGSLDKWLFEPKACSTREPSSRRESLDWHKRYAIAIGTAHGLAYLHDGCREPILHLDIKPQNILLDDKFQPKLADFGMSRLLDGTGEITQVVTAVRGTPGYLAPEWIRYSVATKKCDVYSFGMVLLELISGRRNFRPEAEDLEACYFPAWAMLKAMEGNFVEVVDVRLGLEESEMDEVERLTKVALWCIQEDPSLRPSITVVVKMLEGETPVDAPPFSQAETAPRFLEALGVNRLGSSDVRKDSDGTSYCSQCTREISGPR